MTTQDKDALPYNSVQEKKVTQVETLIERIRALDEKFTLLFTETEKRNAQRFDAQQEAVRQALLSAEKAVTKAEIASEKRFEGMNEFRQSLTDQTNTYMPRAEYTVQHKALSEKVDIMIDRISINERSISEIKDRGSGRNDIWMILVTVVALIIAAAEVVVHWK